MKKQLVIIPGWGGTVQSWNDFIELANTDFEVHFIDMPCFGDVPCPSEIWGVEEYAKYVIEKTKYLEKPILLGHSFGGQVAVNMVASNPEMFSAVILSGAVVIRLKYTFKRTIFGLLAKVGKVIFALPIINKLEKIARKILYKVIDSPDYDKTEGVKREIFQKIIRQDQTDNLERIKIPTLVVWGSRDSYVPLKYGIKIADKIPNAKLEIIQDGTHGLHMKRTKELFDIVKNFVAK